MMATGSNFADTLYCNIQQIPDMKRIIPILALCLTLFSGCNPLRIVLNSKDEDGSRTVLTSDKKLFGNFWTALGASVKPTGTVYGILVTCDADTDHGIFDKGDQLLIRLTDNSVIKLDNIYHKEFEKETETQTNINRISDFGYVYNYDPWFDGVYISPFEISRMVPTVSTVTTTRSYALYLVSPKQLEDIMNKGVIKLRIQIEDNEFDMPDPGKVSKLFSEQFDCLKEGIANKVARADF